MLIIVEDIVLPGQLDILAKCVQLADIHPGMLGNILSMKHNMDMLRSARNARLGGIQLLELMSAAIALLIRFPNQDGLSALTALEKRHRLAANLTMYGSWPSKDLCPFTVIACCIAGYVIYRHMQPRKNVTGPAAGEPAPATMGLSKSPEEI